MKRAGPAMAVETKAVAGRRACRPAVAPIDIDARLAITTFVTPAMRPSAKVYESPLVGARKDRRVKEVLKEAF